MKEKTSLYYHELPAGYHEKKVIDAMNKKTMLAFNGVAVVLFIAVFALCLLLTGFRWKDLLDDSVSIALFVCCIAILVYMVLHELVHGLFYKLFTREKLTFGLSLSCAWCGVPTVYVKRNPMLITCLAPFVVFTVLGIIAMFFVPQGPASVALILWFACHVSGCVGDLYDAIYLLSRCPATTLINDTGAKQTIYVPDEA